MTWQPTRAILAGALAHAATCQPAEACGVVADGAFVPVRNVATGHDQFCLDPRELLLVQRSHNLLEAIVHSHIYLAPVASEADLAGCERSGLPWLIVAWPTGAHAVIEPRGWRAPLVGRQWAWGTQDCFALIRDGLADYAGIHLPDFPRAWDWWHQGADIIAEQFELAGFVRLAEGAAWQHCDVAGMQVHAPVVNHLGLFLAPDILLHQMLGRLSERRIFGGIYRDCTVLHLRHRALIAEARP